MPTNRMDEYTLMLFHDRKLFIKMKTHKLELRIRTWGVLAQRHIGQSKSERKSIVFLS